MQRLAASLLMVIGLVLSSANLWAQSNPVPNPSFENWSFLPAYPTGWFGSDPLNTSGTIFKSTDAHSGSYAVGGKVVPSGDTTMAPILMTVNVNVLTQSFTMGFPVSFKPTTLEGYLKFTGVQNDFFYVIASLTAKGQPVGMTSWTNVTSYTAYQHFAIPISYSGTDMPDTAIILIQVGNNQGNAHVGTTFVLDDIALTMNPAPGQLLFAFVEGAPNLLAGSTTNIDWLPSGPLPGPVDLDWTTDGGTSWLPIQHSVDTMLPQYQWTVPNTTVTGAIVRVQSGESAAYSTPFNIGTSGVSPERTVGAFALVPNPITTSATISYDLTDQSASVTFVVYDLLGREVSHLSDGMQGPGAHALRFDATSLPPGVYEYALLAGQTSYRGKLSIVR